MALHKRYTASRFRAHRGSTGCVRMHTHAYARAYACVRACVRMDTHVESVRTHVYTYAHTCVRTRYFPYEPESERLCSVCVKPTVF